MLEATRTYWITRATFLPAAGFAVSVVNPAHVHSFAKAQLTRSKTDAGDAQTLAQFAENRAPPPAIDPELQHRFAQRDTRLTLRQQVKNHRHARAAGHSVSESVRERMHSRIPTRTDQSSVGDSELRDGVGQNDAWQTSIVVVQTLPGIGVRTACWWLFRR